MITLVYTTVSRYLWHFVAAIAILSIAACNSRSSSTEHTSATFTINDVNSGAAITPNSSLFGLTKVAISNLEPSTARVEFNTIQGSRQQLIPDLANPGQFWLPIVLARTAGTLSISTPERVMATLPVTLMPFKPSGAPGADTQTFLQSSLSTTNAAINDLRLAQPLPDLFQALQSASDLTQQALTWVTDSMKNGEATIARRTDGRLISLTTENLQMLDQLVLYTDTVRINGGKLPAVAHLSSWIRLIDHMIPSAFAHTTDQAAFTSAARATGDALGLTANIALRQVTELGNDASRPSADVQVISLTIRALYAANYGNALATILMLPNMTFAQPLDEVEIAVGELFAGVVNEIKQIDITELADDAALKTVKNFTSSVDRPEVENILMDIIAIFKTNAIGISLCPAGMKAIADPKFDSVSCQ